MRRKWIYDEEIGEMVEVTTQDPFVAMGRMGLELVNDEL